MPASQVLGLVAVWRASGRPGLSLSESARSLLLIALAILWLAPLAPMCGEALAAVLGSSESLQLALDNFPIARWYLNTLVAAGGTALLVVLTAAPAGYAFARIHFRGSSALFRLAFLALLVPPEVTYIPLFLSLASVNLADTFVGLILPQAVNALALLYFRAHFAQLSRDIEEAAQLDGASRLVVFLRLVVPLSWTPLAAMALLSFVSAWNSFLWPLLISQTDATRTLAVGTAGYFSLAGATLTALPPLLVFVALSAAFLRGSSLGPARE